MTVRQELINMIAIKAVKSNRISSKADFETYVGEFTNEHYGLRAYLKTHDWARFCSDAFRYAQDWKNGLV